jgi:hypothetical protein
MTGPKSRPLYGQWLRDQRRERGWTVPEMARKLREAATGEPLPETKNITVMIHRWEVTGAASPSATGSCSAGR